MKQIEYKAISLPDIALPTVEPIIGKAEYEERIALLRERAVERGIDTLIVYGDREHWANITFLTKYDPRFEEALLVLDKDQTPLLIVGNEGTTFSQKCPVEMELVVYQEFSLMGQDRSESKSLHDILKSSGVAAGKRIGVIDWKYFEGSYSSFLNTPSYIVDTIRDLIGTDPLNVTDLLMNPDDGLRIINSVSQLARFEFVASCVTDSVKKIMFGVSEGMNEFEAYQLAQVNGLPYSCHPVFSAGAHAGHIDVPSSYKIKRGDPVIFGITGWGALSARAGFLVSDESELAADARDYLEKLVKPYFGAVSSWYETIGIGVTGGELFEAVHENLEEEFTGLALNPGHYIHLEEWVHSPVFKGSEIELKSGMALQADIIPVNHKRYFSINAEDGIALADEKTRQIFSERWPEGWSRIEARRKFMQESLGITLKPEVLPFSNIQAYLPPFLFSPHKALALKK